MNTGIYQITAPSGRRYVGSAVDIERRWRRHRTQMKCGTHGNRLLQRAAEKYGVDALVFSKILICSKENLLLYEQIALDSLKPEYNLAPIAGSSIGIKRSDEFKRKIVKSLTGRIVSEETRRKIGAKHKGKKISDEQKAAVSKAHKGKRLSAEHIEKMRRVQSPEEIARRVALLTGRPVSPETREKIRISVTAAWARRKSEA